MRPSIAKRISGVLTAAGALLLTFGVAPADAQLNTQHIKGLVGLKAGSMPPPHWYVIAPLVYLYNTDTVKRDDGTKLPLTVSINSTAVAGGVSYVSSRKILGGFYNFQLLFPAGINNRLQGTEIDQSTGFGITDSAVVPFGLGWHFKRADAIANYAIFLPTGRYEDGASDNTGFGMWGHEIAFGTTVYLNEAKQYHAASVISFDFQTKKEDSETKVGNAMNLEGGFGGDFMKGGITAGLAYYASFKLTDDEIEGLPGILIRGKNKVFALGPEVTIALASKTKVYGFLKLNYEWEVYARTTTQGSEFSIMLTLPIGPFPIPTK
jgi:hypothetical protein